VNVERSADVIVVGLGAMGSAVAAHLARRGRRVLGFDRFSPPHAFGSSHGETRIIREAYFEDPRYVPMVQRAWALWEELARETGRTLIRRTGGLMIGPRDGELVTGVLASARAHGLEHELLSTSELRVRIPAFAVPDDHVAVAEPRAGMLFPEACVAAHLDVAERFGATLRREEPVLEWRPDSNGVEVSTASGRHRAAHLVLAAGAWIGQLVAPAVLPVTVERQVAWWFEPAHPAWFDPEHFPIYIWEHAPDRCFYGFPRVGKLVKAARHHEGSLADAETLRRDVDATEAAGMQALVERFIPDLAGPPQASSVCMYTNTRDEHFVVDAHPAHPQVTIVSACSGHGFKFASALGESVAARVMGETPRLDLGAFALGRSGFGAV
jgi:sarcosine oxidase